MTDLKKVLFLYRQSSSFTQGVEQEEGVGDRLVVEGVGDRLVVEGVRDRLMVEGMQEVAGEELLDGVVDKAV